MSLVVVVVRPTGPVVVHVSPLAAKALVHVLPLGDVCSVNVARLSPESVKTRVVVWVERGEMLDGLLEPRLPRNLHLQEDETATLIERRGWRLVETYKDEGISGSRERRPGLDRLLLDARRRKFDAVVVWKADRLFRSLKNMVVTLDEWNAIGVGFVSATEVFDSTTPQGRLLMHLVSAFGEFERAVIVERTRAGIAAARRRGARIGRPRARIDDDELQRLRGEGLSVRQIAEAMRCGSSTVQRRLGGAR